MNRHVSDEHFSFQFFKYKCLLIVSDLYDMKLNIFMFSAFRQTNKQFEYINFSFGKL